MRSSIAKVDNKELTGKEELEPKKFISYILKWTRSYCSIIEKIPSPEDNTNPVATPLAPLFPAK